MQKGMLNAIDGKQLCLIEIYEFKPYKNNTKYSKREKNKRKERLECIAKL